ncbi:MAG: VRR-NUC domain-containing protein [Rhodospirillales bacterium]|nr:VRR-NUC domain-containing protein [Rhodospirillales bacterium]
MGQRAGTPDLILCWRGRFVAIELKAPGKVKNLSESQRACHADIAAAGGTVATLDSLAAVIAFLDGLRVPRIGGSQEAAA